MIQELDSVKVTGSLTPIRSFCLSLHKVDVHVCSLGASILSVLLPNSSSGLQKDNVVLGYSSVEEMWTSRNPMYLSVVPGRVANRIRNGCLQITSDGPLYNLDANNAPNHLHGGLDGFSHRIWVAKVVDDSVLFTLVSNDGDQGYPGAVRVVAEYSLRATPSDRAVRLCLNLKAELLEDSSAVPTPINLTQHTYWNLDGHHHPDGVLNHDLRINADSYTPVDTTSIPTRDVQSLEEDSVMDWRKMSSVREKLEEFGVKRMSLPIETVQNDIKDRTSAINPYGFDHNYVVNSNLVGVLRSRGGRRLTVESNAPGVQLYTGNYLDGSGPGYSRWQGLCLETQHFPDAILVDEELHPDFAKGKCPILTKESPSYRQEIVYTLEYPAAQEFPKSTDGFVGEDSEDNSFPSVEAMWQAQGVTDHDSQDWYERGATYYRENCPATIDGVLGGFASISDLDLSESLQFVVELSCVRPEVTAWFKKPERGGGDLRACECGAGLGRVTKGLLLSQHFLGITSCDVVEPSQELIAAAPDYLGNTIASRCRFFCVGLQLFQPSEGKYAIMWVQWTLSYLTDTDIISFLQRCSKSLSDGGLIFLKENICENSDFVLDSQDASVTRSSRYWKYLIGQAGLRIVYQSSAVLHESIYPVPLLALEPASS